MPDHVDYGESAANKGRRHFLAPKKFFSLSKSYGDKARGVLGGVVRFLRPRGIKCKNPLADGYYSRRWRECPIDPSQRYGRTRDLPPYFCSWCPLNKDPIV